MNLRKCGLMALGLALGVAGPIPATRGFKKLNPNGVQGTYPREDTGWAQESALDLDMASAMCPGCKLILVEGATASFSNLATAANTAANQAGVTVISNSYGGSE